MAFDPTTKPPLTEAELEDEILRRSETKTGEDLFEGKREAANAMLRELEAKDGEAPPRLLPEE